MGLIHEYKQVVLWGGRGSLDSSRHIYRSFHETLRKIGVTSHWVTDDEQNRSIIGPGSLVFAYDIWGSGLGHPVAGADYLLHNFDASHPIFDGLEREHLVRLQVYTDDAATDANEQWAPFRLYSREGRVLFQPWGTNLLAEEFLDPVWNPTARDCTFVGAVWDDGGLGNVGMIPQLTEALRTRGLRFEHLTHVSDAENIHAVRTSRIAPALAGPWQVQHNYLPCRVFKNVSYGALAITNVRGFRMLFGATMPWGDTIDELVDNALAIRAGDYLEAVRAQQRVAAHYTYRESLEAIARAFQEGR